MASFRCLESRPRCAFAPARALRVKVLNLSSRTDGFLRKRRQKGQAPPAILKAQPVAENVTLMRFKRAPSGLQFDAPPVRFIYEHTQLHARRPVRAQLLDEIFLCDARIEHAFDQQEVAPGEINLCAEGDVLKAAERLMIQTQKGCAKW